MIRRRDQHGLVLIPQAEVARIAGLLAGSLGGKIEAPSHMPEMARAAELSQRGWEELDDFPQLDSHSLPCEGADLPRLEQIEAWQRTTEHAWSRAEGDGVRVAALLSILAMQWSASPALHRGETRRETFEFNRLVHLEAERLEGLREYLGLREGIATRHGLPEAGVELSSLKRPERELVREVRLLEALLELSAEVCGHTVVERTLGVCARTWDSPEELVRSKWRGAVLQVAPWCWQASAIDLTVQARAIAARRYRDIADLRQGMAQAGELSVSVHMVAAL